MTSQRINILVLDSDPEFLIPLQHLLQGEGFDTTVTWDVGEAVALLESSKFDLLLVGEHPPEVKSAEVLMRLRAMPAPASPCIILQADERHPFESQYLCWFGADAVLPKWKHTAIMEHVRKRLRHSRGMTDSNIDGQSFACA
jgi:CheY-like chemotaxis protein